MNTPLSEETARQIGVLRNVLYRAWPTRRDFSFNFEYTGQCWRVYINTEIDYRRRPSGMHPSHRIFDGARRYVCYTPEPTTLSMAQSVAALWADATENYIATGQFEPAAGRPQVTDRSVLNGLRPTPTPPSPSPAPTRPSLWSDIRAYFS